MAEQHQHHFQTHHQHPEGMREQPTRASSLAPPTTTTLPHAFASHTANSNQAGLPDRHQQFQRLVASIDTFYRVVGMHRSHEYEAMTVIHAEARNLGLPPPNLSVSLPPPDLSQLLPPPSHPALHASRQPSAEPSRQHVAHQQPHPGTPFRTTPYNYNNHNGFQSSLFPHPPAQQFQTPAAAPRAAPPNPFGPPSASTPSRPTPQPKISTPLRRPETGNQWWSITAAAWAKLAASTQKRYAVVGRIMETEAGEDAGPCDECSKLGRACRVMKAAAYKRGCGITTVDRCASCVLKKRKCSLAEEVEEEGEGERERGVGESPAPGAAAADGGEREEINMRELFGYEQEDGESAAQSPGVQHQQQQVAIATAYPLRRPQEDDRWWSVSKDHWDKMKPDVQKRWSTTGRLMETDFGEPAEVPCDSCRRTGINCRYVRIETIGCGATKNRCAACVARSKACRTTERHGGDEDRDDDDDRYDDRDDDGDDDDGDEADENAPESHGGRKRTHEEMDE